MIGLLDAMQRRPAAQVRHELVDQIDVGQGVSRALEEQHWKVHLSEMFRTGRRRLVGRVEWKAKKSEAANAGKGLGCLCLRRHSSTKGFASGNERKIRQPLVSRSHGGPNRLLRQLGWIGSPGTPFHVRELKTQGRNLQICERLR